MTNNGSYLDKFSLPLKSSFVRLPFSKKKFTFSQEEEAPKESDSIKVFLRIKPLDESQLNKSGVVFEVVDSSNLVVRSASDACSTKKLYGKNEEHRYTFTHIFGPEINQQTVFEDSVKAPVIEFINGFSSLIFSYGTTNAGKTYTVQGTKQNPGLIPRALNLVFNAIEGRQTETLEYMPYGRSVRRMSAQEQKKLMDLKQTVMYGQIDEAHTVLSSKSISSTSSQETGFDFKSMEYVSENETDFMNATKLNNSFSLWISFFEIYNECIYDLLQPLSSNNQRKALKISEDKAKNCYVRDLNYINVTSAADALRVLFYGKNNLQIAMTGLNKQSSRSHCIFTLTLVSSPPKDSIDDIVISQLSLCDLAGTERQKKTQNVGERLKESQHINCSLHVLSRCFDIIRENQNKNEKSVIPYRESKLTRLFQKPLKGEEKVIMLVNVNTTYCLEETHQVLKTSAIARKITSIMKPSQQRKRRSRSLLFSTSYAEHSRKNATKSFLSSKMSSPTSSMAFDVLKEEEDDDMYLSMHDNNAEIGNQQVIESLLSTIDSQKKKIEALKSNVQDLQECNRNQEQELRTELGFEYGKLINTIEDRWKARIAQKDKVIEELKQWRDNCMENRETERHGKKRKIFDCSLSIIPTEVSNIFDDDAVILKEENNVLRNDIHTLKSTLAHYKDQFREVHEKYSELKFLNEVETISKLREAVLDDNMQGVLQEMENMKEKLTSALNTKNALLKEAFEEIKLLENSQNELLSENEKLQENMLSMEHQLEELKKTLSITNEILSKKTEENQEMEIKLDQLEKDNENLLDYIDIKEGELKYATDKLENIEMYRGKSVLIEPNQVSKVDDLEKSVKDLSERLDKECSFVDSLNSGEFSSAKDVSSRICNYEEDEIGTTTYRKDEKLELEMASTKQSLSTPVESIDQCVEEKQVKESIDSPSNTLKKSRNSCSLYKMFLENSDKEIIQVQENHASDKDEKRKSSSYKIGETVEQLADQLEENENIFEISDKSLDSCQQEEKEQWQRTKAQMEQQIFQLTNDIEEMKKTQLSTIKELEHCEEEKNALQKLVDLFTNDRASADSQTNMKIDQLAHEIEEIKNSNSTLKTLLEQREKEKWHLQEEIQRLEDHGTEAKVQIQQRIEMLILEIKEIKQFHLTTTNLLQEFNKEKSLFQETIKSLTNALEDKEKFHVASFNALKKFERDIEQLQSKICSVSNALDESKHYQAVTHETLKKSEEDNELLRNEIHLKGLKIQELLTKSKKEFENNQILQDKVKDMEVIITSIKSELEEVVQANKNLLSCNKEYAEMKEGLVKALDSKNVDYDDLLQRWKTLEEEHGRLKNELSINRQNLEKQHNKEIDRKNNEMDVLSRNLKHKEEEILKLQDELCKVKENLSTTTKCHTPQKSKTKLATKHLEDMDDVFFTPSYHENQENNSPENIKGKARSYQNKTLDFSDCNATNLLPPKPSTAKRITRSMHTKVSSRLPSTPHEEILRQSRSEISTDRNKPGGVRRLLSKQNPEIQIEEFPDDPEVQDESPVSTVNRLTDIPQRKLRNRKKKQF